MEENIKIAEIIDIAIIRHYIIYRKPIVLIYIIVEF